MNKSWNTLLKSLLAISPLVAVGCAHMGWNSCNTCGTSDGACQTECQPCGDGCQTGCGTGLCGRMQGRMVGWFCRKSNSIPDTLPLGHTVRSHYQTMETNAEAVDFILNLNDFVGSTANLTPDGKDKILEIAARMRSQPFPVVIERSLNDSDPELDQMRRNVVAQILSDLGNPDAQQRTVVATPYGPGYTSMEAEMMYYRHMINGGGNGNGNNFGGGGGGFGGGFGGGGGGGGGFF